jgi:antitoxin (DNA-binding transcriptional repressor) of toxin-antitoxin stability system
METTSISYLKTHLSAELKKVQNGVTLMVMDHRRPVATIQAVPEEDFYVREAESPYKYRSLTPLISRDLSRILDEERKDSW